MFRFCRSKCHRNFKAKRNPRKLKSVHERAGRPGRSCASAVERASDCGGPLAGWAGLGRRIDCVSVHLLIHVICVLTFLLFVLFSRWTKAFRKAHGKELVVDSTFEFERLRHRPIKYNRDLMGKTIQAMQRIAQIKARREQRFWQERMKDNVKKQKAEALRDLAMNIELIKPVQDSVTRKTQLVAARVAKTKTAAQRAAAKAAAKDGAEDIEE